MVKQLAVVIVRLEEPSVVLTEHVLVIIPRGIGEDEGYYDTGEERDAVVEDEVLDLLPLRQMPILGGHPPLDLVKNLLLTCACERCL